MAGEKPDLLRLTFELEADKASVLIDAAAQAALENETLISLVRTEHVSSRAEKVWLASPTGYFIEVDDAEEGPLRIATFNLLSDFATVNGVYRNEPRRIMHSLFQSKTDAVLSCLYYPKSRTEEPAAEWRQRHRQEIGIRLEAAPDLISLVDKLGKPDEGVVLIAMGGKRKVLLKKFLELAMQASAEST